MQPSLADEPVLFLEELISSTKDIEDVFTDADLWNEIREIMTEVVRPIFMEAYLVGAELGAEESPVLSNDVSADDLLLEIIGFRALPLNRGRIENVANSFVDSYTNEWWSQFSRSTQNGLRRAITRNMNEGTGIRGVIADIAPLFGKERAKRIAISESTTLMGGGAQETYREAGYQQWEWRTANDGHVDPTCSRLSKKVFPMSVRFERAHVGCRCWPVPAGSPAAFDKLETQTVDLWTDERGAWLPERVRLHDQIVRDHLAQATPLAPDEQPTFYMMGGGPASGKSTVEKSGQLIFPRNRINIDPDAIKKALPEYNRMLQNKDPRAAAFAHKESSYLSQRIVKEATDDAYNVLLDGTGDGDLVKLGERIEMYRRNGHRVVAEYMSLDTELALKIQKARAAATGRMVPEDYLVSTHAKISEVLPEAIRRGWYDELRLWDTNVKDVARQIAEYRNGEFTILDDELWRRFLAKADDVDEWIAGTLGPETLTQQTLHEVINAAQQEAIMRLIEQAPAELSSFEN